jgi:hypothetical protein
MLRWLVAAGALGSLAGCVVGSGYGYNDQGYPAAPVYGAEPAYGYAPVYGAAPDYGYGQVGIVVNGHRYTSGYYGGPPPRADWHGPRDDNGARTPPARGGYGGPHPQPGQETADANGGRNPNWHGANPAPGGGGQQGRQGGGSRQDAGGSNGRPTWQGNGNARW